MQLENALFLFLVLLNIYFIFYLFYYFATHNELQKVKSLVKSVAQIYTGEMRNGFVSLRGYYFYWQTSPNHSHFACVNLSPEFALKRDALEEGVTSQTFLSTLIHFPFSHLLT